MFTKYVDLFSTSDQEEAAEIRDILNANKIHFRTRTSNPGISQAAGSGFVGGGWNGQTKFVTTFQVDKRDAGYASGLIRK